LVYRHAHKQLSQIEWLKVESKIDDLNWILFWEAVAIALLKEKVSSSEILKELANARDGKPSERVRKLCSKPITRQPEPSPPSKKRFVPKGPPPEPLYLNDAQIEELIRKKDVQQLAYHYRRLRSRVV
jgi:hypothetical protein